MAEHYRTPPEIHDMLNKALRERNALLAAAKQVRSAIYIPDNADETDRLVGVLDDAIAIAEPGAVDPLAWSKRHGVEEF